MKGIDSIFLTPFLSLDCPAPRMPAQLKGFDGVLPLTPFLRKGDEKMQQREKGKLAVELNGRPMRGRPSTAGRRSRPRRARGPALWPSVERLVPLVNEPGSIASDALLPASGPPATLCLGLGRGPPVWPMLYIYIYHVIYIYIYIYTYPRGPPVWPTGRRVRPMPSGPPPARPQCLLSGPLAQEDIELLAVCFRIFHHARAGPLSGPLARLWPARNACTLARWPKKL